ncbi:MAG: glucose-6-phosphate isomerase [Campylobacteraceae bacterium]|nr:glucose-6-phosphate isomerase [Campylobacteraceae bacterium]
MMKNSLKFNFVDSSLIDEYAKRINDEFREGKVGYFHLPNSDSSVFEEADEFIKGKEFKSLVVVGMGGSSLGTKAVCKLLGSEKAKYKINFLDNLDVFSIKAVLSKIEFEKTLFFIVSKSGTTIETITIFKHILNKFSVSDLSKNFVFITDPGSKLEALGKEKNVKIFYIPKNVGGRFSVLSPSTTVVLRILGYDVEALLEGAKACAKQFFEEKDETILQKAYHYATHRNTTINVLFSYGDRFKSFNNWYIQLWAESLGKKKGYKRVGLTPIALVGSRDQHSFLQLIMDGVKDKTVTFIKVKDSGDCGKATSGSLRHLESCDFVNGLKINEILNLQCDSTMQAVINEGVSVDLIEIERLDEWHVGYLLYYYMLLTSIVGVMLDINTYDQPGVEIGKRILKTMISK